MKKILNGNNVLKKLPNWEQVYNEYQNTIIKTLGVKNDN